MGEHRRKADGRRVFSTEFKRKTVQRIVTGEKTVAELSRELDIAPSVIRNWKRFAEAGATTAVQASEDVVPRVSCGRRTPRSANSSGRWAARQWKSRSCAQPRRSLKKPVVAQRVRAVTRWPLTVICQVLRIARRTAYTGMSSRGGELIPQAVVSKKRHTHRPVEVKTSSLARLKCAFSSPRVSESIYCQTHTLGAPSGYSNARLKRCSPSRHHISRP
jgi:transposase-like protein